jgi:hypothetical protein
VNTLNVIGFVTLAAAIPSNAAEPGPHGSMLDRLGGAVVAGDEATARSLLSSDAKVISYFDKELRPDSLEVLIANFEGVVPIKQGGDGTYLAYDMCNGTTTYVLQVKEDHGKITEVRYGTLGFSPPPVPYSMRKSVVRCKPPVRFLGGF